jgi:hypothetical protein
MVKDAISRIPYQSHLVSGGAAWADHLAVELFLQGHASALTLHLPAPFTKKFEGPMSSSASAANFYHSVFSRTLGRHTLSDIERAIAIGAELTTEPARAGYGGMFARNLKVAKAEKLLAYTFGPGDVPADGGTRDTWDKCLGEKVHVSLPTL